MIVKMVEIIIVVFRFAKPGRLTTSPTLAHKFNGTFPHKSIQIFSY